jgi:hypothetical protein
MAENGVEYKGETYTPFPANAVTLYKNSKPDQKNRFLVGIHKKDAILIAVNNAIDELNEIRKKRNKVLLAKKTSKSKSGDWSALGNDTKYVSLVVETNGLYASLVEIVAEIANPDAAPVATTNAAAAGASPAPVAASYAEVGNAVVQTIGTDGVDTDAGVRDELEHSLETKQKVSDVTEVIYDGITYTKKTPSLLTPPL